MKTRLLPTGNISSDTFLFGEAGDGDHLLQGGEVKQ